MAMAASISSRLLLLHTIIILSSLVSSSSSYSSQVLTPGSSLSVENKDDLIVSPNGLFTTGFHQVGENAYVFAVWFTEKAAGVVWMANRDEPVNGHNSRLSLWKDGNLVLIDAGQYIIWSTQTESKSSWVQLKLHNSGNLVVQQQQQILWQSFDHPTDTLLPNQLFTRNTQLVSSQTSTNCSSGFYQLIFDNDSILRLVYNSPETTSIYWPDPRSRTYDIGRFEFIVKREATLDSYGRFNSTDGFSFITADFGKGPQRMMRLDTDGNLRVYSLVRSSMKWEVQWQAINQICRIDGTCGPNSLCTYTAQNSGRKCNCIHGFKMVNPQDWSYGCEPAEFNKDDDCDFIELPYAEFYGYDIRFHRNITLDACKKECLQEKTCSGFNFAFKVDGGYYFCFLKSSLHNGYQMGVYGSMYIKLPKTLVSSFNQKTTLGQSSFSCPKAVPVTPLIRSYNEKTHDTKPLGFMLVVGCVIGFIEIVCIVVFWYCSSKHSHTARQLYLPAPTGFRKFTYSELKKASSNFSEEIGRGGASVVYKARLKDNRIAAIKKLKNSNDQGEDEFNFQAEISTIGRMNHMNLIETWGYCAEGKHRLIVYEYMENGSLANNLGLDKLDWPARFNIVTGTAKGLAYLHEECLEWILHCDVKPHNILLDANYNPNVADFGLSKRSDRGGGDQWNFSMMRGTRGYMAPEWVLNLPITSKVDVFSYGVVILEIITGRSPGNEPSLIDWVRDRYQLVIQTETETASNWVEGIVDPSIRGEYDMIMMENVVRIALQCTEEDGEARPTMSQVVNMLLLHM